MNPTKVRHPRSFEPARRRMRECGGGAERAAASCLRSPALPPPAPVSARQGQAVASDPRSEPQATHRDSLPEPAHPGASRRGRARTPRRGSAGSPPRVAGSTGADPVRRCRSRSQVPIPFAEVALGLSSPGDQPGSAPRGRLGPCNAPTGVEVQGLRSGAQGEGLKVKGSRSRAQGPGLEARGIDAPEHTGGAPVTHANAELRPPDGRERAR